MKAVKDTGGPSFCANDVWYRPGSFKSRLVRLAGWWAEKPELRTSEAYDVAYDELYQQLPDCRARLVGSEVNSASMPASAAASLTRRE